VCPVLVLELEEEVLLEELELEPELVPVPDLEPAGRGASGPAVCDPAPPRPSPLPAPLFINVAAPDGRAGRVSPVTFHCAEAGGQVEEWL